MRCYDKLLEFKKKFPGTVIWRAKKHCKVIDKHLNPNEELLYVFGGQLNNDVWDVIESGVVAITTERLMVARDFVWPGYKFISITPDLYNDLAIKSGILWGTVEIDTIKETVWVSDISKKAMFEIETIVTTFMEEKKKEYGDKPDFGPKK